MNRRDLLKALAVAPIVSLARCAPGRNGPLGTEIVGFSSWEFRAKNAMFGPDEWRGIASEGTNLRVLDFRRGPPPHAFFASGKATGEVLRTEFSTETDLWRLYKDARASVGDDYMHVILSNTVAYFRKHHWADCLGCLGG